MDNNRRTINQHKAMGTKDLIDAVLQYGAVPLLVYWVWTLRSEVREVHSKLDKAHEEHKKDLKVNNEELKTFVANLLSKMPDNK